jgi:lactate dehydrogenase-like 2-hydroxyacid dehydrogenase
MLPLGRQVTGKRLGIVGLGHVGRLVAKRAQGFDMEVRYTGPRAKSDVPYQYVPDLMELARSSDFLAVSCPGGPSTRHLIDASVMDALGPQGTLVSISRGSIIDERALADALRTGRLGAAPLDMFQKQPHVPDELLALPNLIVQPHRANATVETREAVGRLVLENLFAKLDGRPLVSPIK